MLLERLACAVESLMVSNNLFINHLTEFLPETDIPSLNEGRGMKVSLRLRRDNDQMIDQFLPTVELLKTLIRELAHNCFDDNDERFHNCLHGLNDEYRLLVSRNIRNIQWARETQERSHPRNRIKRISVLPHLPNAERAMALLEYLARSAELLMKANGLFIDHLTEFLPEAGARSLNEGRGMKISIRLRKDNDQMIDQFLPDKELLMALFCGLANNRSHDDDEKYKNYVIGLKDQYCVIARNLKQPRATQGGPTCSREVIKQVSVLPHLPNAEGALVIINRLALMVEPLMISNGLSVDHLKEFLPQQLVGGRNQERGATIFIRLRRDNNQMIDQFLSYGELLECLIRTLGHNRVYADHGEYQSFVTSLNSQYKLLTARKVSNVIKRISVLPYLPNAGRALDLINRIARKVEPLMVSNRLFVHHLTEFLPRAGLTGTNEGLGLKISIRLRPNDDRMIDQFLPTEVVIGNLLCELAYNLPVEHYRDSLAHLQDEYRLLSSQRKHQPEPPRHCPSTSSGSNPATTGTIPQAATAPREPIGGSGSNPATTGTIPQAATAPREPIDGNGSNPATSDTVPQAATAPREHIRGSGSNPATTGTVPQAATAPREPTGGSGSNPTNTDTVPHATATPSRKRRWSQRGERDSRVG